MSSDTVIVAIVTDDKTYAVDKRKLIENSDYFRALYGSGMRESTAASVRLRGLSGPGLELVLGFIDTSEVRVADDTLEDLIEAASFLQVTPILSELLPSEIRAENCVALHRLSEAYGAHELRRACLQFMSCHYHPMLRRPEFRQLPAALRDQVRETRMTGTATLLAIGDFTRAAAALPPHGAGAGAGAGPGPGPGPGPGRPDQDGDGNGNGAGSAPPPWSMLRYGDAERRWRPLLSHNLPSDMRNVRGYGYTVLHNYLFIVGGYRVASQEMSAAHCYNPCRNEWVQVAPLNQKRSNFKLLAAQGRLFAVGGQSLGTVESYSPEQDWWTCVASMPEPLAEFSACECQGMIYVMGGYTQRDRNLAVLRYCPSSDAWSVLRSCRGRHVRKQQMLSVEDTLFLVGGYTHRLWGAGAGPGPGAEQENTLRVQSYNVTTGEWLRLKENALRSGLNLTCALHNDGIYIMGRDVDVHLLKFDLFSGAWESGGPFPALGRNMLLCSLYLPPWL